MCELISPDQSEELKYSVACRTGRNVLVLKRLYLSSRVIQRVTEKPLDPRGNRLNTE